METNERSTKFYSVSVEGGNPEELDEVGDLVKDKNLSPNGEWMLVSKDVKIQKVTGKDHYKDVPNSNIYIYDQLNYRHWDTGGWCLQSPFIQSVDGTEVEEIDLMEGEPYDCPQKPFEERRLYLEFKFNKCFICDKTCGYCLCSKHQLRYLRIQLRN